MTGLQDYQDGFLGGQQEGAMELLKAMQAGQITGRDTTGQTLTMEPLKAESLETTLKLLEYRQQDIKLFNRMPKLQAYNTVEEFLQLSSYGVDRGGFYNEGALSDVEDSQYIRRAENVKYLQVTGSVTMQAQMVRSYVDAMRKEVENKAMWIMRRANIKMTSGDANLIPQEWNGLYKQHAAVGSSSDFLYSTLEQYFTSTVIIDLRGRSLKQADLEIGAVNVDLNYGNVTDLFAPTTVISTLSQDYYQRQRILQNAANGYEGVIGTIPKAISTTMGDVALMGDKFLRGRPGTTLAAAVADPKAPAAPTAGTNPALVADSSSKYGTGTTTETGTTRYAVSAINSFGESALTLLGAADVTIAANFSVDLTFTATAGTNTTTGFRIWRTLPTVGTSGVFYPLFTVSTGELAAGYDGAAALSVRDRGRFLPNTEQAFLTEMADDVLSFKQLAPISKLDLAVISMARNFITFMFGTPVLYTPKKMIRYINCSNAYTTV